MLHVAFVRSPYAHARIRDVQRRYGPRAWTASPLVVTGADLGRPHRRSSPPRRARGRRPGAGRCSRATASATSASRSRRSSPPPATRPRTPASWSRSTTSRSTPVRRRGAGARAGRAAAPRGTASNNFAHIEFEHGDVDGGVRRAPRTSSEALPLRPDPRGAARRPRRRSPTGRGDLTVWSSTQMPFLVRSMLAALLRPGGDAGPGASSRPSAAASGSRCTSTSRRRSSRSSRGSSAAPVKWVEDRYEHLAASGHSKEVVCDARAGARRATARSSALRGRLVGDGGAHQGHPWSSLIDPLCAAAMLPGHLRDRAPSATRSTRPATNKCPTAAYRGVGWTAGRRRARC